MAIKRAGHNGVDAARTYRVLNQAVMEVLEDRRLLTVFTVSVGAFHQGDASHFNEGTGSLATVEVTATDETSALQAALGNNSITLTASSNGTQIDTYGPTGSANGKLVLTHAKDTGQNYPGTSSTEPSISGNPNSGIGAEQWVLAFEDGTDSDYNDGYFPVSIQEEEAPCNCGQGSGGANAPSPQSDSGVKYGDGGVAVGSTDLSSGGNGGWAQSRGWSNLALQTSNGINGNGINLSQNAHLTQIGTSAVQIVTSGSSSLYFNNSAGTYAPHFFVKDTLVESGSGSSDVLTWTDPAGNATTFHGFDPSVDPTLQGKFLSFADTAGNLTIVKSYDANGNPTEVISSQGSGTTARVQSFQYTYVTSGVNAGKISNVLYKRGTGDPTDVSYPSNMTWDATPRQVAYTYYDGTTTQGNAGDLQTATTEDGSATAIDTQYYRYYTPLTLTSVSGSVASSIATLTATLSSHGFAVGDLVTIAGANDARLNGTFKVLTVPTSSTFTFKAYGFGSGTPSLDTTGTITAVARGYAGGLKYSFDAAAYARLAASVASPLTASDSAVAPYATNYYEYDSDRRASKVTSAGAGNSGGQGTYTYAYTASTNTDDYNNWKTKTVETLPDGNQNIVYTNNAGEIIVKAYKDTASGNQWVDYYRYNSAGQVILHAHPSAVSGYSESLADLIGYNTGTGAATYLNASSGLIDITDYGSSTTATSTTPGDVTGYLKDTQVKQGTSGTPILQCSQNYFGHTTISSTTYPLATVTTYGTTGGGDARTTTYAYTWVLDGASNETQQMASTTVTKPPIVSTQNGPASSSSDTAHADVSATFDDAYGRTIWSRDADGHVNYTAYDTDTGAVVKTIVDVTYASLSSDEQTSFNATGWTQPTGGLHLVTTDQVDGLGRMTEVTDPNGNITYMRYNDVNHEQRTYVGWHSVGGGNYNTTAPVQVTREYRPGTGSGNPVYDESLTATIANTTSAPSGTESLSTVQTLSRDYTNNGGQTVRSDRYFSLSGTSYSTTPYFGTLGTNFYTTTEAYDSRGRQNRVVDAVGTINRTVYDGLSRTQSTWIGTSDTVTGTWSPSNVGGMTQVSASFYDGYAGSLTAVGDSNLTRTILYPSPYAAQRVTESFYDWRDRKVAEKDGVKLSGGNQDTANEDTSTHRLITYNTLDNLGEVTQRDSYAADQVGITFTSGVPNAPTSSKLRGRSTASYDDQGRVYQSAAVSVNSSGTVGSSLTSNIWFDHRGNVIKTASPGGQVAKSVYDGAGRVTTQYSTDGGGDSSWTDAGTVTGDIVLSSVAYTYDADSNVLSMLSKQRFHDDLSTDTGALGDASTGPKARLSYQTMYYDAANRLTDSVDVGTNGGSAYTRPSSAPTSSTDTLHLNHTAYNAGGWTDTVTDARGVVTKYAYDLAGRATSVINAYNASINSGNPSGSNNQTTTYTYDGVDHTLTMTAVMPTGTNSQTTAYIYGVVNGSGSWVTSNDLLAKIEYPSKSTGSASTSAADQKTYGYNALGEVIGFTDQNGTFHSYAYDTLARSTYSGQTNDLATVATGNPQSVDTSVLQLATFYDDAGRAYLFTSYDGSGTTINQVERLFNGFGQVTQEYQEHSGGVSGGSSASVQYGYDQSNNDSRLSTMTYVNGRILHYGYNTGLDSNISRLSFLADDNGSGGVGTHLEDYSYLGDSTIVKQSQGQPGIDLTYIKQSGESNGAAGDQYNGLDQFGRVIDQRYIKTSTSTATDRFQYGYDRANNVLYKNNLVSGVNSELYHANSSTSGDNNTAYDPLSRLTAFARGTLTASANNSGGLDTISSSSRTQGWTLDQLGNWTSSSTNGTSTSRTTNSQNEVTAVGSSSLTFDNNGNTTQDETGKKYVYDAWNRLVAVKNSGGTTLETYKYDALGRRIVENPGTATDLYYGGSADWQVLEEKQSTTTTKQNVWSQSYIDDLVLRDDNSTSGNLGKSGSGLGLRLYVQHDANHNVTALLNTSGTVQERFVYDPYGAATVLSSSWSTTTDAYAFAYRHQGGRQDTLSGLVNFRNRNHSATLGRWMTNDPAGYVDGFNTYLAFAADPLARLDPMGLKWVWEPNDTVRWVPGSLQPIPSDAIEIVALKDENWVDRDAATRRILKQIETDPDVIERLRKLATNDCPEVGVRLDYLETQRNDFLKKKKASLEDQRRREEFLREHPRDQILRDIITRGEALLDDPTIDRETKLELEKELDEYRKQLKELDGSTIKHN